MNSTLLRGLLRKEKDDGLMERDDSEAGPRTLLAKLTADSFRKNQDAEGCFQG